MHLISSTEEPVRNWAQELKSIDLDGIFDCDAQGLNDQDVKDIVIAIQARDTPLDMSSEEEEKRIDSVSSLLLSNNSFGDTGAAHLVKFLNAGTFHASLCFHSMVFCRLKSYRRFCVCDVCRIVVD